MKEVLDGIYRMIEPLTEQEKIDLIARISLDLKCRLGQRVSFKDCKGILGRGVDPLRYQSEIRGEWQ
jgi:hypothetical protein